VTFKDLQKAIQSQQSGPEQFQLLLKLRDKPSWISDPSKHNEKDRSGKGECCFNHIIGLPKKYGVKKPLFDYEVVLYKALSVPGLSANSGSGVGQKTKSFLSHSTIKFTEPYLLLVRSE
jgi:hypothetical protein